MIDKYTVCVPAVRRAVERLTSERSLDIEQLAAISGIPIREALRVSEGMVTDSSDLALIAIARVLGFNHVQAMGVPYWHQVPHFTEMASRISDRTLLSPAHLFSLFQFSATTRSIPGHVAEVGVFRGGSARMLAEQCPERRVLLFDTFEGLPHHSEIDMHRKGDFSNSDMDDVARYLADLPNISIHAGVFPNTAEQFLDDRFSFVHVDVDVYESVVASLAFFYSRLNSGGIIVFDDFGYWSCPGVEAAVLDFFSDRPEKPILTGPYQAAVFKH